MCWQMSLVKYASILKIFVSVFACSQSIAKGEKNLSETRKQVNDFFIPIEQISPFDSPFLFQNEHFL